MYTVWKSGRQVVVVEDVKEDEFDLETQPLETILEPQACEDNSGTAILTFFFLVAAGITALIVLEAKGIAHVQSAPFLDWSVDRKQIARSCATSAIEYWSQSSIAAIVVRVACLAAFSKGQNWSGYPSKSRILGGSKGASVSHPRMRTEPAYIWGTANACS